MSDLSDVAGEVASAAGYTVARTAVPWLIAVASVVLISVGCVGLYFGTLIEAGRMDKERASIAQERLDMKDAYQKASDIASNALAAAIANSNTMSGLLQTSLGQFNTLQSTFQDQVNTEVTKISAENCKLPQSSVDLAKKIRDQVNSKIPGAKK